jgi:hypothetical protein
LELNEGLFDAADWLAMLLVEQRQYDEAESVMKKMKERLNDPSPAMGRLAWIRRERGDKQRAREEMASVLRETPWYRWGWSVLMEWLGEDQASSRATNKYTISPPTVDVAWCSGASPGGAGLRMEQPAAGFSGGSVPSLAAL